MKTVFLIDDDLDDREIFQIALQSLKLDTVYIEAKDGQEALHKIGSGSFTPPDIIFADLNMPRVNGLEFLMEARKNPVYSGIPVYIYSTSSARAEHDKCMAAGATGFITKHSSIDELCHELKKVLGHS